MSHDDKTNPKFERKIATTSNYDGKKWLDPSKRIDELFIKSNPHTSIIDGTDTVPFYQANWDFLIRLWSAGNDLHKMCIQATEKVLKDDDLLAKFGIPAVFWDKIKHSFATQKNTLTGRFDFACSGRDIKMYEYNADSASTLYENGALQQMWINALGMQKVDGKLARGAGFNMRMGLCSAWQATGINEPVHFLIDDDDEEEYTALYMADCAGFIGLDCKIIRPKFTTRHVFDELVYKDGLIYDKEGVQVKHVWKTWSWDTVFNDYLDVQAARGAVPIPFADGSHPHLSDILLNTNTINVFEPLWKTIPGNKAILPVLWEMFPGHPNLLRSEWTLTPDLISTGYASKPIVGRQGLNITLVKSCGTVLSATSGKFSERDMIYQELFPPPQHDGHHALIGGWIIGGFYSGTGIREDTAIITSLDSPCPPLLVVRDDDPEDDKDDKGREEDDFYVDPALVMKFGTVLGHAPGGVPVYSSDYKSNEEEDFDYNNFQVGPDGKRKVFCGAKWQCVEFSRRFLINTYGLTYKSIPMAFHIFELPHFNRISDNGPHPVTQHVDGSKVLPKFGSLLIWKEELRRTGHVAIITNVTPTYVDICEQNWDDTMWKADYSRRLDAVTESDGSFYIKDKHILGWINL
jgi:glutathionylspermidine synthase